ncbi:O-fucosyltransferase 6 [Camellia lanceoleosa]|uniref:O-fucosyltransferase 6 n=1 Tax=Camellia lanceoleosa TaxID=1840588 RepID=A0ACC0G6C0_9ERIC|nr:O-fucosyltransferase 6 [Camellia lanceoleosa]
MTEVLFLHLLNLSLFELTLFKGKVNPAQCEALAMVYTQVLYDDGDVEVLYLDKERWELIDNGHKPRKVVQPGKFDYRLSNRLDTDLQKLGCIVNYHALKFTDPIIEMGDNWSIK